LTADLTRAICFKFTATGPWDAAGHRSAASQRPQVYSHPATEGPERWKPGRLQYQSSGRRERPHDDGPSYPPGDCRGDSDFPVGAPAGLWGAGLGDFLVPSGRHWRTARTLLQTSWVGLERNWHGSSPTMAKPLARAWPPSAVAHMSEARPGWRTSPGL